MKGKLSNLNNSIHLYLRNGMTTMYVTTHYCFNNKHC